MPFKVVGDWRFGYIANDLLPEVCSGHITLKWLSEVITDDGLWQPDVTMWQLAGVKFAIRR